MPADLRTLRGEPLAQLARDLEQLRAEGKACWRCDRLLAGGVCERHGRTGPPRMRGDLEAAARRREPPSQFPVAVGEERRCGVMFGALG